MSTEPERKASLLSRYGVLAVAVAVIALAGYVGYVLYPRFDLPGAQGAGLLGLAAAAGVASFFSPCSFPLLLGLLGRQPGGRSGGGGPSPAVFGGALATGAAVFMLVFGLAIAAGGEALFAQVTFASVAGVVLRATVGVVLIALGLVQSGVVLGRINAADRVFNAPIARYQARLRRRRPVAGYGVFGFGYVLSGFG
jgi:cytochrome c-type biogenesis protein